MAGARRAAGLVPADAVVTVPVLETSGEKIAGVRRSMCSWRISG